MSASMWIKKGDASNTLERYREAELDFFRALAIDPSDARAWRGRAVSLQARGQVESAMRDYHTASQLDPSHGPTWYNLATNYHRTKQLRKAISYLTRALDCEPGLHRALRRRAQVRREAGDRLGAYADLDLLLKRDPKPEHWALLATFYEQDGKRDAALEACERGLRQSPGSGLLWGASAVWRLGARTRPSRLAERGRTRATPFGATRSSTPADPRSSSRCVNSRS